MMIAPVPTSPDIPEQAGGEIARRMLDIALNSADQAQALIALHAALNEAFNPDDDPIVSAVAGGFAVPIVNILERGFQAMRGEAQQ